MTESNNIYNEKREKAVFPARLSELLEKSKESQEDLAKIIGVSQQQIDHYTKGHSKPKIENLITIAMHYGVSVDWLIGVPDAPKKMDATKQSVMEYTGLSETLLDAVMDANRRSKDALAMILFEQERFLHRLQRIINLFKNPCNINNKFNLLREDKRFNLQNIRNGFDKRNAFLYEPDRGNPFEVDISTLFDIELHNYLDHLFLYTSNRMKRIFQFFYSNRNECLTPEMIENQKKRTRDPLERDLLEQLKGELYGIDNSTKE